MNELEEKCPSCGKTLPTTIKERINHLIDCKKLKEAQK